MSQSINEDKKYISEIRDSSGNEYKIISNRIEAPTYVSGTFYRPGDQVYKDDVLYTYVGYDSRSVYDNSFSYMFEKANFAKRSGTLKAVGKITYKTDNARYLKIYENISDGYYSYFDSSYFKKLKQGDLIVVRFQEDTVIPASTKVIEIINAQENGSYCFSADVSWPGVSYHYKSKQDYTIPANEAAIFRITTFGINNGEGQYTLNDCLYIGSTTDVHNYHDPSKQDKEEGKGLSTNDFTNEYKSKVDGAQIALSKESYKVLIDEFNAMEEAKGLLVGQNIYIQTIEVPDLWISSIEQTKQTYTYTTDQALIDAIKLNGSQQIGFYKVSILETAKVDLSGYYTKIETDGKVDLKMNKANPVGTGSFSLNRFPNSNVGSNSTTLCNNNTASGSCSMANGSFTKALGFASHSEGYETEANGGYSHAEGQGTYANGTQLTSGNYNYKLSGVYYEPNSYFINMKYISGQTEYTAERKWLPTEDDPTPETSIVVNIIGSKDDTTQQISLQKNIDFILSNNNYTLTLTSTALQKVSSWSTVNYINEQYNPRTPHGYYTVVGNGLAHERSNAYALSSDGTGRYAKDVYVNCNSDSTGGKKLATEEYVDTHSISDIFLVKTVHDDDNNKYRADKTAIEIYEAAKSGKKVIMQERPQNTDLEYAYFELVKVDKSNDDKYYIRFSNLKNVKTGDISKIRYEFRYIDKEDGSTVLYTKEYTSAPNYPSLSGAQGRYLKVNENEDGFEWGSGSDNTLIVDFKQYGINPLRYQSTQTLEDIYKASQAGKLVLGYLNNRLMQIYLSLAERSSDDGKYIIRFSATSYYDNDLLIATFYADSNGTDTIFYYSDNHFYPFENPEYGSEGQVLTIEEGEAVWKNNGGSADDKMDIENPYCEGYFSMNRKSGTITGNYSVTLNQSCEANAVCSIAQGSETHATGIASHSEGYQTKADGHSSHAEGCGCEARQDSSHAEGYYTKAKQHQHVEGIFNYELEGAQYKYDGYSKVNYVANQMTYTSTGFLWNDDTGHYVVSLRGTKNSKGEVISVRLEKDIDYTLSNDNLTITLNQVAIDKTSGWNSIKYVARELNPANPNRYINIVGNGIYGQNSNAYALSNDGTGHYAGDIYVNCERDSTGGKKLATEEYVNTHNIIRVDETVPSSYSFTGQDNTYYKLREAIALNITIPETAIFHLFVFFAESGTPSINFVDKIAYSGDSLDRVAAGDIWEFSITDGFVIGKKWEVS